MDVEINGPVLFIGVPPVQDDLDDLNLFDYMPRSRRFYAGGKKVEFPKDIVEIHRVALNHLHGFDFFEAGLF